MTDIIALNCQKIKSIVSFPDLRATGSTKVTLHVLARASSVNEDFRTSYNLHALFGYGDIDCKSRNYISIDILDHRVLFTDNEPLEALQLKQWHKEQVEGKEIAAIEMVTAPQLQLPWIMCWESMLIMVYCCGIRP
jgi:hypothetical protein